MVSRSHYSDYADQSPDDEGPEPPSKSSRKRAMHALQDLGQQLVELSVERLRKVPMPEELFDAVRDAQRFTAHEARRRQMQYIGKLMRNIDPEPIQAQLDIFNGVSAAEVAKQHRLEKLRTDFLEDEKVLEHIANTWPQADLQHLRTLRRNALKERDNNKPPKSFREIFRILRELEEGSAAAEDDADYDNPEQA